jgi:hypothetical protein
MCEEGTIRRLVKEIDGRFDCHFDRMRQGYTITQTSPLGRTEPFAFLPWDGVTKEFFDNMRFNMYVNRNGDPLRELMQHNDELERRRAEKADANIDYMAKVAAPDLLRAFKDV